MRSSDISSQLLVFRRLLKERPQGLETKGFHGYGRMYKQARQQRARWQARTRSGRVGSSTRGWLLVGSRGTSSGRLASSNRGSSSGLLLSNGSSSRSGDISSRSSNRSRGSS